MSSNDSISELSKAGAETLGIVTDPEFTDLLTTDPSLLKQLALNATKAAATHDVHTSGLLQILQSMQ